LTAFFLCLSEKNGKWKQMRVSECRDCLQAMPSGSILEQAKLGQLLLP
jgi:hypothetical protein